MFDKLYEVEKRYDEITARLYDPAVTSDVERYRSLMKESAELAPIVEKYREYQQALRYFNSQLVILKGVLGLTADLSSYAARHTWATMAYYSEVHPGIISEAMGHSSITVTETYLKPFKNKKIDEANATVFSPFRKTFLKISC